MVSPPRSAKHAAAADAGPACARSTPAHGAPAARPAYWLAQRAAPADLASRPRTAPRAPPAVGQRLLLLLLPSDPHASRRWPTRACQKRDGAHSSESLLSKSNNNPRMHARELSPYHSSPLCHPPTACIALRPAYTHKYTYIFRHIDRSLLAATSRASRPRTPPAGCWPAPAACCCCSAAQRPPRLRRWPTRACQKRDGAHSSAPLLSRSTDRIKPTGRHEGCALLAARSEPSTAACATP